MSPVRIAPVFKERISVILLSQDPYFFVHYHFSDGSMYLIQQQTLSMWTVTFDVAVMYQEFETHFSFIPAESLKMIQDALSQRKKPCAIECLPGSEVLRQHILRNKFEIANSKIAERMLV